jgi:hypothetical protein
MFCHRQHRRATLRADSSVDAFLERTSRRIDCKILFILLEHFLVVRSKSLDLVNVRDGSVWSVRGNLASRLWIHARKIHVFALDRSVRREMPRLASITLASISHRARTCLPQRPRSDPIFRLDCSSVPVLANLQA